MKKFLRNNIDLIKRNFQKGEKFEKFAPAVNAFDTFLFVPNHTTQKGSHIRDAVDLKRTMVTVIIALMPVLILNSCKIDLTIKIDAIIIIPTRNPENSSPAEIPNETVIVPIIPIIPPLNIAEFSIDGSSRL